jgi:hypothetical protein
MPNHVLNKGVEEDVKVGPFRDRPIVCSSSIFSDVVRSVDSLGKDSESSHRACIWLVVEGEAQCPEGLVDR